MRPPSPPDDTFQSRDWSDPASALEYIRQYAEKKIFAEWSWYQSHKQWQSSRSQWLRWVALLFSITGGVVPLLTALFSGRPDWPWVPRALGAIRFGQLGY